MDPGRYGWAGAICNYGGVAERRGAVLVEASIEIARPPQEVFDVFADDANFFALRPSAIEHRDVVPLPGGGHNCTQVYRVGTRTVVQECRTLEFSPPRRFVGDATSTGSTTKQTVTFVPLGSGTEVRVSIEIWPRTRIGVLTRGLLHGPASRSAHATLRRLKELAEPTEPHTDGPTDAGSPPA